MKLHLVALASLLHLGLAQVDSIESQFPDAEVVHFDRTLDVQGSKNKWDVAYAKAKEYLSRFNLTQKITLGTGVGWPEIGACIGNIPPIPEVDFPGLCLDDSPLGIRWATNVSAFPAAIHAASTFNRDLIYKRGAALGEEFRGKGIHIALGPMMNLARAPAAGRNWEGWGGDPYLSQEGAAETVKGIQSKGVQATAKHYVLNEQEHFRDFGSSNVDARTLHEIYASPFLKSLLAGASSVMCSYNRIDNIYACEHPTILNELLKGEYGFKGYIMSDWWATHSTESVNTGLDMTMPGDIFYGSGTSYFGSTLEAYVNNGTVSEERIDDLATRILAPWFLLGQDKGYPETNIWGWNLNDPRNKQVNVQGDHYKLIREIVAAGTVLLKNVNGTLPLKKPASLGIIGTDAKVSPLGPNGYSDRAGNDGTLAMAWGSGTCEFPYLVDPLSALEAKAAADGTTIATSISDSDLVGAATAASGKTAALVFINSDSGEGYLTVEGHAGDRNDLLAWHNGDALVKAVAAANKNTIVVVHSVGAMDMEAWIEHPNVTAVVWAGLPGQESGNGLVDVLYGAYNPSGRLPYTIGKSRADYSADVIYVDPSPIPQIYYDDKLLIDYRWFDAKNIKPRFEFGFGLSYTTFKYGNLGVWPYGRAGGPKKSLDTALHEKVATITFTLQNTGAYDGTEIPQLYVHYPEGSGEPPQVLRGFESVFLKKKHIKIVKFDLTRFDLSIWSGDLIGGSWVIPAGQFGISVGASSRDKRLTGKLKLW